MTVSQTRILPPDRVRALAGLSLAAVLLAACTTKPEPMSRTTVLDDARQARVEIYAGQEPVAAPLTLEDVLARAVLYNLDNRVALLEQATQQEQLAAVQYEMLPELAANAGYFARDKYEITSSRSLKTGKLKPGDSISDDKRHWTADLTLSWNILDFGTSYFQSKQQADKVLIARERKRRAINNIYQEVTAAYWDAMTAQRLLPRVSAVLGQARRALDTSQALESSRAMPLADALRYQRDLLNLVRQLEAVADDMTVAKLKLSRLMGLPMATAYTLAPAGTSWIPRISRSPAELELIALVNRPEVQEERYNVRIAQTETRVALLKFLPSFNPFTLESYDSNSYLTYNSWTEAGFRSAFDLIRLAALPAQRRLSEGQVELARQRRLAISMAVVSQVHISLAQLAQARHRFGSAAEIAGVERRLSTLSSAGEEASANSELDRIRQRSSAVAAELDRDRAYADMMNAYSAVFAALGVDQLPEQRQGATLDELSDAIHRMLYDQRNGHFPAYDANIGATVAPPPSLAL